MRKHSHRAILAIALAACSGKGNVAPQMSALTVSPARGPVGRVNLDASARIADPDGDVTKVLLDVSTTIEGIAPPTGVELAIPSSLMGFEDTRVPFSVDLGVPKPGIYTLSFRAVDSRGNRSNPVTATFEATP
jgi:hypothetical protein